jgi:Ca2+:H+ antiporter
VARWMGVLLAVGAIAVVARVLGAPPLVVFALSAAGIIPMAGLIGRATEDLAHHVGPKFGGLLNATFGNAAELIIAGLALREGLLPLVKASITGSILGNSLFVLGTGVLVGGLRHGTQRFDAREATRNSTMMLIAVASLVLPAAFAAIEPNELAIEEISVAVAVLLLIVYAAYVVYSLTPAGQLDLDEEIGTHVDDEERAPWSRRTALLVLVAATIGTVVLAETLVATVEAATHALGLSQFFVGLIVVPIVGNIAEHFSAVQLAAKNKMETALAIAAGSSTQIALLVGPLLVLLGLLGGHWLTLVFHPLEIVALAVAAIVFTVVSIDGETNWLEGVQLLALYLMLAIVFYFLPTQVTSH